MYWPHFQMFVFDLQPQRSFRVQIVTKNPNINLYWSVQGTAYLALCLWSPPKKNSFSFLVKLNVTWDIIINLGNNSVPFVMSTGNYFDDAFLTSRQFVDRLERIVTLVIMWIYFSNKCLIWDLWEL